MLGIPGVVNKFLTTLMVRCELGSTSVQYENAFLGKASSVGGISGSNAKKTPAWAYADSKEVS